MTQKITIVHKTLGTFGNPWIRPLLEPWLDFEQYQPDKIYDTSCLFYIGGYSIGPIKGDSFYQECLSLGRKMIYDNLFDPLENHNADVFVLSNDNWFWYNESLLFSFYGYNKYVPDKNYQKLALMPLRRLRPYRDQLVTKMSPWLDQCYWSYMENGRQLPGDRNAEKYDIQRDFQEFWYNDTCFSIVSETLITNFSQSQIFLSEKTMKPLAFFHPMLIWGQAGSLEKLRSMGFETFENLFDESYDKEANHNIRLAKIINNVKNYSNKEYDTTTWQKLQHNRNRFFDTELIKNKLFTDLIAPLLDYAET